MSKMSISDASAHFGISKEAIHNRIRRGSLQSVVENGIKLVLVEKNTPVSTPTRAKKTTNSLNDKYYKLLEEQNAKLQSRVDLLENETRSLRDQKEQMLIDERVKIEQIYKDKDEQLKNILTSFKAQFMLPTPKNEEIQEHLEVEIQEPIVEKKSKMISLNKYLKSQNFSIKKIEKIKARFKKYAKKDERIIILGKKYYIDLDRYDYSDLLKKK